VNPENTRPPISSAALTDNLPQRFLVALDERATIPALAGYVARVAAEGRAIVRVVHIVDHAPPSGLTLETRDEAASLVEEAVFALRMAGVGAHGAVRHSRLGRVGLKLLEEASNWSADAIVLGARRAVGWQRLLSRGVREQVLRRSTIVTVLVSRHSDR
jgi:nucleotide-binding universal stress UspA family protein